MDFKTMYSVNVNDRTEKKNGLTYLSWAWAWAEFKKAYPDATYSIYTDPTTRMPYMYDQNTGYMCMTSVTAEGITHDMWLPVMDNRNRAMMTCTMFDVNKTLMRCLTKNLAMFGLGLYIYAGEDLPEEEKDPEEQKDAKRDEAVRAEKISKVKAAALMTKCEKEGVDWRKVAVAMKVPTIYDLTEEQHYYILQKWDNVKEKCQKDA